MGTRNLCSGIEEFLFDFVWATVGVHVSHNRVRCFGMQCPRAVSLSLFHAFSCDLDNQMTDFSFVKRFGSRLIFVERGPPKRVGLKVSPGCRWRLQNSWGLTAYIHFFSR